MMILSRAKKLLMSERRIQDKLYSGSGNTFVLIDNRPGQTQWKKKEAIALCTRYRVDGVLVVESSSRADVKMRILNRDGSEPDMCGNGSRCVAYWAHHEAGFPANLTIEAGAGLLSAKIQNKNVKVRLTDPTDFKEKALLGKKAGEFNASYVNTGVPHVVIGVDKLNSTDVPTIGRRIRYSDEYKPDGTNVSFYEKVDKQQIRTRTYERGVEAETRACGTGAAACALVAALKHAFDSPVRVCPPSGETLLIYFNRSGSTFKDVYLEGPVEEMQIT